MKIKSILFVVASVLCVASNSSATTVSFTVGPTSRTVGNEAGTVLVSTSSSFWVGTFATESAIALTANNSLSVADNITAITAAAGWEQFTFDTTTSNANSLVTSTFDISAGGIPGRLGGSATDTNTGATKADFFNNKGIYVWVFNSDNPATATEMGIFRAPAAGVPWTFPTNTGGLGDSVSLSTASSTTINAIGGVGSTFGTSQLRTEAFGTVPEPSRMMLVALGAMGVVVRRRRK